MTEIYACLAGNWVCLNDDPNCRIGENLQKPSIWWEENAPVYAPGNSSEKQLNSLYGLDYVHILYTHTHMYFLLLGPPLHPPIPPI